MLFNTLNTDGCYNDSFISHDLLPVTGDHFFRRKCRWLVFRLYHSMLPVYKGLRFTSLCELLSIVRCKGQDNASKGHIASYRYTELLEFDTNWKIMLQTWMSLHSADPTSDHSTCSQTHSPSYIPCSLFITNLCVSVHIASSVTH